MDLQASLKSLDINTIIEMVGPFVFNLIYAIVIFVVGKWLAKSLAALVGRLMTRAKVDIALVGFVTAIVKIGITVFAIVAAIDKIGIKTTSFLAILGAAGLAIGMALQGTLSNFAAGVMLILFKPFSVGDFVEGGGVTGVVKEIQIFNTVLHTGDNRKIIVPNSKIGGETITNYTAIDRRRIDMVFGVSYDDDLKKAKQILLDVVLADPRVLKDPAPVVAVSELADSSVNIILRPWVKPSDYWGVHWDTTEKVKEELEAAGLSIPYPQRDIHMNSPSA